MSYRGHPDQRWGHTTYAQHGDDLFLLNVMELVGVQTGTYLDVGAHHPTNISNTKLLYDRGWRGANVEANPKLFNRFLEERPFDKNLCVAVGDTPGTQKFYMFDDESGRNTFSEKERDEMVAAGYPVQQTLEIPIVTLDKVVAYLFGPDWPDLLTMDIEGLDFQTLLKSDLRSWKGPKVICAEVRDAETQIFKAMMLAKGYFCLARLAANLVFVAEQYERLVR
jgi:FkbM family methyltransferase